MEERSPSDGLDTVVAAGKSDIEVGDRNPRISLEDEPRGVKRPAEDDEGDEDGSDKEDPVRSSGGHVDMTTEAAPLSKNRLKKLRRQERWEEKKAHMKEKRKEKRHDRRERKKLERESEMEAERAAAAAQGRDPASIQPPRTRREPSQRTHVPVTVIIDCQFEKYMMDKELVSLCSQVTRCYSENRSAQFPVHTFVSSYAGAMKTRFETALVNQHQNWKGIHFREGDFMEVAGEAKELMAGPRGGQNIELLEKGRHGESISLVDPAQESRKFKKFAPPPELEADDVDKSVVYLTADSPYTLDRLEPNTCYVIGGIIDKNREKGLCYKMAREKKIRTAKLPIGEFMVMQSRHILATNHVMDIILKYLELGDWGAAFMKVIPTRKGGKLREDDASTEASQGEAKEEYRDMNGGAEARVEDKEKAHSEPSGDVAGSKGPDTRGPEVEGATPEDGLQKNALGEKEWSAPPVGREKSQDLEGAVVES